MTNILGGKGPTPTTVGARKLHGLNFHMVPDIGGRLFHFATKHADRVLLESPRSAIAIVVKGNLLPKPRSIRRQ